MKHIQNFSTIILALATLSISVSSCKKASTSSPDAVITKWVKATTVPQNIGPGSTLVACSYDDGIIGFRIETTPDSLKAIDPDQLKSTTIHNWQTNLNTQRLIEQIKKADASLKYTYVAEGDSLVMVLNADELQ